MNYVLSIFLLFCVLIGYAQQGTVTSGGTLNGSGGSTDFSIGQVVYLNYSNDSWQISEGIQQPLEIYQVNSLTEENQLFVTFGPNPTADQLIISVENSALNDLSFTLVDLNGRSIIAGALQGSKNELDLKTLAPAQYMLTIYKSNKPVNVFKLIKNN
jgi:hypothetical protein